MAPLTEEDEFGSSEEERRVLSQVTSILGEATVAAAPSDVVLRGIRAMQDERRRKGREWSEAAADVIRRCLEWRRTCDIEALAAAAPAQVDGLQRFDELWRYERCGSDEWGHPCVWDHLGSASFAALLSELGEARVVALFMRRLEQLRVEKLAASAERHHAIYKHIFVLDLRGLSAGVLRRENRELLFRVARQLQASYPESMLRVFVVNSPMLFSVGWKLLQPGIDPVSWAKFKVVGSIQEESVRQALVDAGVDASFLASQVAR